MLWMLLPACQGPAPVEPGTPTDPCATGTFGWSGGELVADGAILQIPPDALVEDGIDIQLCPTTSTDPAVVSAVWEVVPTDLLLDAPLSLVVEHTGDDTSRLFSSGPDGTPWPNLHAVASGESFEAPLYRAGAAWVAEDPRVLDSYEPASSGMADVLFVVDNSCGMADDQVRLGDAFEAALPVLASSGLDFHVGVVTTDINSPIYRGKLQQAAGVKWIDPTTPNPAGVLTSMAAVGEGGSALESGLGGAYLALEAERDGYNAGFYRDEASLGVVVVSDEPDYTPSAMITSPEFVDWFDDLKPSPDDSTFHGIISAVGTDYEDVAIQTGGSVQLLATPGWDALLSDVFSTLDARGGGMALDAAEGTISAWWVPADGEQQALDFEHDVDAGTVWVDHGEAPIDEVFLLSVPAE